MKIINAEYSTIYEIYYKDTLYVRQIKTTSEGINRTPLWFISEDDILSIIIDEKQLIKLEQEFLNTIE